MKVTTLQVLCSVSDAILPLFSTLALHSFLQENRYTAEQLSEEVGLSPSACLQRVKHLRKIGVIEREVVVVSPKAASRPFTIITTVTFHEESLIHHQRFEQEMRAHPLVSQCYYVTGASDFVMILSAENMDE
ncbi:Lrp/AsnC family transcriptional regulator [Parendozoicomonas sp. Alg238-R29]|uniref:Lrp/AsnC family transcriptional regulator n=1 Tax=Parendozoicomonas sp. Alg238-R29 TaxID=2993446 RepID=UPI00248F29C5|nr:Lrp/AsnC family transcriptional regulator [Parendozoicomonas sp. Alg238-R29]